MVNADRDRSERPARWPFEPPYGADDLPQLDSLHNFIGLGPEWLASDRRAEIAAESPMDAGTATGAPAPSQAATEAHSGLESWSRAVAAVTPCSCSAQRARAEAAEAKVARVEALADVLSKLSATGGAYAGTTLGDSAGLIGAFANDLRAALAGPATEEGK